MGSAVSASELSLHNPSQSEIKPTNTQNISNQSFNNSSQTPNKSINNQ